MSFKEKIFNALVPLKIPVYYAESDLESFPKIIYTLVSNVPVRFSNQKVFCQLIYQVSFYDEVPHDVEFSETLLAIEQSLEDANLFTTNWQEVVLTDDETNTTLYHYFLEVSN